MTSLNDVDIARLDRVVRDSLDRWGVPGATLGVSLAGETIERAYGVSNLETIQPARTDTIFRIASISKPFTATLAMTLVDEGLLDLDEPIATYLPELPLSDGATRRALTMRNLLSHMAGFDCEFPGDVSRFGNDDGALGALIANYGELRQWTPSGDLWSYCNSGFWLAGAVITKLSGQTFEQAMRERVFEPLGLERSCFEAEEAIVHPVALGHQPIEPTAIEHKLIRSYAYPRARRPSGGVISNAGDLLRFANAHLGLSDTGFLSESSRLAMQQPISATRLRQSTPDYWGIGWEVIEAEGGRIIGHGGSIGGFQTQIWLVPDRQFAFTILTNSSRGSAAFPAIERHLFETITGSGLPQPATTTLSAPEMARVAGRYEHGNASMLFTIEGEQLRAVYTMCDVFTGDDEDDPPIYFSPVTANEFIALDGESEGARLDFIRGNEDAPKYVRAGGRIAERIS